MSRLVTLLLAFALLFVFGCGTEEEAIEADTVLSDTASADQTASTDASTPDATSPSDATTSDSSATLQDGTVDTGSADTTGSDLTTSDVVDACGLVTGFEKGCGSTDNCVIGYHQVDCCGTLEAVGINHSERDRFDGLEDACRVTYPGCGCAQMATLAEDGQRGFNIGVVCDAGTCKTFAGEPLCEGVVNVEKGCSAPENCSIGWHQVDCCGTVTAIGMNHSELAAFEGDEALCRSTLPMCNCPPQQPTAEDGKSVTDPSLVQVTCSSAGLCETFVP